MAGMPCTYAPAKGQFTSNIQSAKPPATEHVKKVNEHDKLVIALKVRPSPWHVKRPEGRSSFNQDAFKMHHWALG